MSLIILDEFQITIKPLKMNFTLYDEDLFIFLKNGNCTSRIIYYMLIITRIGSNTITHDIYTTLILKNIRFFFFFSSVLLFITLTYFIISLCFLDMILFPLSLIKEILHKILLNVRNFVLKKH